MTDIDFEGVLFFPVTPFDSAGSVEFDVLGEHVASGVEHGAGAVFSACGTGEFHALSIDEAVSVTERAVTITAGRVPVVAGVGGSVVQAVELATRAEAVGADALLVLPPYMVAGPAAGLERYVRAILAATSLPVILYNRSTAVYSAELVARLAADPQVIGFKDGVGDLAALQQIVLAVRSAGRQRFHFFNGLLTAELSQGAYRGVGVPLYSSAAFAMIPEVATAYYDAYITGDEPRRLELLEAFYVPLVALRDEIPGFGVSLIKAGLRLSGLPVGSVRAPFVDPTPEQESRLVSILETGRAVAGVPSL